MLNPGLNPGLDRGLDQAGPTARALLALELLSNVPGITADRLAERLGVSERAARRYVGVLREAGIPVESTRGPYGGYRVGRGVRVPPLMLSTREALGLVMALLERRAGANDPDDPVGSALNKIIRVLPRPVAEPVEAVRRASTRSPDQGWPSPTPDPSTVTALVEAGLARSRVRLAYRTHPERERSMDVDPWAVVVRHDRWYLLGWSHLVDARRILRVDRVASVAVLDQRFVPPLDLDPAQMVEEHLAEGWAYAVDVEFDAPVDVVSQGLRANLGRLESINGDRTRLIGSTDEPDWYVAQLQAIQAPFRIVGSPEVRAAAAALGRRLVEASA